MSAPSTYVTIIDTYKYFYFSSGFGYKTKEQFLDAIVPVVKAPSINLNINKAV